MNYKFKTKPYDHQIKALEKSVDEKNYAYFMEWVQVNQKY